MSETWRTVRVFISSTFGDMQAERDELAKFIFPQLRKLCEQRGVTWGEVDLRWGIPDEQKAEGKVLPICLEEIRRCRPYFIGLLGERYGWIPDEIPQELIEREPWLAEHRDHSVTELEILHGVLNNPRMADHAFFYFREPGFIESVPVAQQSAFREVPTPEETEKYGDAEAMRRAEERKRKLQSLKARIRDSALPVQENYRDPKQLGEWVLRDLTAIIDRLYPEGTQPDPLDRDAADHEAFARSRAGVYIGRQKYFDRLDYHARGDAQPLVVLGESGSGKSALLANWARQYRDAHQDVLLLMHFIGATPDSADWMAMLRRIMGEFKRRFDTREEIPDKPDALRAAFANWLHMAAAKGRVVLILDALNQLEDRDGAPDLVWLPPVIPANVRVILSTLPGRPLDDLVKRGWQQLNVEPLTTDERKQLISEYLAQYTKALASAQMARIASAPQSANPLYLRALLDELRVFGAHEKLDQRIEHYLAAASVDSLYEKILERYEEDYERERPGLVRDSMTLLWAAKRGLSETELLELLGSEGQPLPRAVWSPLYLAAEQSLVNRSGLIGFFHDYFRQAVRNRYLPTEQARQVAHLRIADYFSTRDLGARKVDEEPWQLAEAKAWERLYALLSDLPFFCAAWHANQFEVKANWALVESSSKLRLESGYRQVLDAPGDHSHDTVWTVGILLDDTGHPIQASSLREYLVKNCRQTGDRAYLAVALGGHALSLANRGDFHEAMNLHQEEERLYRELGDWDGLSASFGNQAVILKACGDLDGAMKRLKDEEGICRELGNKAGLSSSLGNQGVILRDRGDLDGAMALHKESERLCRELGNKAGLLGSLGNQGVILRDRGDLDGAMALHKESERLCRELGNKNGLSISLGNQALILADLGDLDGALKLHKEEERICRELGNKYRLARTLGNQATIHQQRADLEGALTLHRESERLFRELADKEALAVSIENQATILAERGELGQAMALHKDSERLCRELGNKESLARTLSNQALILQESGDLDGAIALHKESERLCRELGNKNGLSISLGNQGVILKDRGELDGAMALHKESERLCRELGDTAGLQASLCNQALILNARGDLDAAMKLLTEQERLCRELGNSQGLAQSLANQAAILGLGMNQTQKARALADEAHRIATMHGYVTLARKIEPIRDRILRASRGGYAPSMRMDILFESAWCILAIYLIAASLSTLAYALAVNWVDGFLKGLGAWAMVDPGLGLFALIWSLALLCLGALFLRARRRRLSAAISFIFLLGCVMNLLSSGHDVWKLVALIDLGYALLFVLLARVQS